VARDEARAPSARRLPALRLPSTGRILLVLVPLFVVCVGAVAAIVALGYSTLSHDVNATNDRVPAAAQARLTADGSIGSKPQVTLVMGSTSLVSAAQGRALRILLVRTDPGAGTISLLAVPTTVKVPLPGQFHDSVTVSTAGPPASFIPTVEKLVGVKVNHLVLADRPGFDDLQAALAGRSSGALPAAGSGATGALARQLPSRVAVLHLSDVGSALRASFASDLSAGEWVDLNRLRHGAGDAVECRLSNRAQTRPGGVIVVSGGANRSALDRFLGRGSAAGACTTVALRSSFFGSGIGAAEALVIAALVLLGLILLTLLRPLSAAVAGRRRAAEPALAMPPSEPRASSPPSPPATGATREAPAAPAARPALTPIARYTKVASGEDAAPADGPATTAGAAPPDTGASPGNGAPQEAPARRRLRRGAGRAQRTATTTRWVRQCSNCGRRELSRQWETREQAQDGGRFALRSRLRRTPWQCERCGSSEYQLVEYKGPRWMQWE
jgi:hypothetical protein